MAEKLSCYVCGNVGFECANGFYYCTRCNTQAEDIAETGIDDDFMDTVGPGAIYSKTNRQSTHVSIKTEPVTLLSQTQPENSQIWRTLLGTDEGNPKKGDNDCEPCGPEDFGGTSENFPFDPVIFAAEIRIRYIQGLQLMTQSQCQVLLEKFGVSPLISGVVAMIWLRYIAVSRVFDEKWADETFEDSEIRKEGDPVGCKARAQHQYEPFNIHGERAVMIWFRSLRKKIPLSTTLAISFLACHVAREPILPTDIWKWALEGELPYMIAFNEIGKCVGCPIKPHPMSPCPLTASFMFRPSQVVGSKSLEWQAGSIAQAIGLQLPPVNFHAIGCRYLKELSLPVEKILPCAFRLHEWSNPPDLWLSANRHRIPTRVCVMSILVIAIRILYNINGFGRWEGNLCRFEQLSSRCRSRKCEGIAKHCSKIPESISHPGTTFRSRKRNMSGKTPQNKRKGRYKVNKSLPSSNLHEISTLRGLSSIQNAEYNAVPLLCKLEMVYEKMCDTNEYSKDFRTYLSYCKDVVFSGLEPILEDNKEEKIIEELWDIFEKEDPEAEARCTRWSGQEESKDEGQSRENGCSFSNNDDVTEQHIDVESPGSASIEILKDRALRRMKLNMEENGFLYIPPRVKFKRFDYLHYVRKNDDGSRCYVAHADYYILLRACARVAQVNVRYMHAAVLKLEKRLSWMENRIDQSVQWTVQTPTESNSDVEQMLDKNDSLDFSNYNFVM